jgi:hypothetical protein
MDCRASAGSDDSMPAAIEASGPCGALGWRAMGKIYPMAVAIARAFKSFDQNETEARRR